MLGASERVVKGLVVMLYSNDVSVRLSACAAIAGLSQNHVHNASLLGQTRGLLQGLQDALACKRFDSSPFHSLPALHTSTHTPNVPGDHVGGGELHGDAVAGAGASQGHTGACLGEADVSDHTLGTEGALETGAFDHQLAHDLEQDLEQEYASGLDVVELKEAACQAMVHLAMQNQRNKLAIVRCPGVLPALRHALLDSMVIANCADNFAAQGGQEAASIIVATPGLLSALCSLVCQSVSSFSDSPDRSAGLAAVISLSDHPCILHHLRAQGFPEALHAMIKVQPALVYLRYPYRSIKYM